jgi:hypothetical protein
MSITKQQAIDEVNKAAREFYDKLAQLERVVNDNLNDVDHVSSQFVVDTTEEKLEVFMYRI